VTDKAEESKHYRNAGLEKSDLGRLPCSHVFTGKTGSGRQKGIVTNMITDSDDIEFYNAWTVGSKPLAWQAGTEITCLIRIQGVSG
jgi:hypothetical protein